VTRTRVLTALALAVPIVPLILFLPTTGFACLVAAIASLAAWEWIALDGGRSATVIRLTYSLVIIILVLSAGLIRPLWPYVVASALVVWCLLFGAVFVGIKKARIPSFTAGYVLGVGVIVPGPAVLTVIHGLEDGPLLVLTLCIIVWSADVGAYFVGRNWGRRKLAPAISPGKTLEGTAGGLLASIVSGMLCYGLWHTLQTDTFSSAGIWLIMVIIVSVVSTVGDLVESVVKRNAGQKDSGSLLPGHGGVLDRIDGLLPAAPTLGIWLIALGVL